MRYTTEQILKAAEIGEVSMIDARHIVTILKETATEPQPFATEQDAINWVMRYTPFAVIPKKKVKYDLVYPFSSQRAQTQVVECIGKALFELLTKTK